MEFRFIMDKLARCGLSCAGLLAGLAAPAVAADIASPQIPARLFAGEPRGPYATGTLQTFWIDQARDEPLTRELEDKRRVTVQIWYPADVRGNEAPAPYVLTPEQYLVEMVPAEHGRGDGNGGGRRQLDWAYAVRHVLTGSVRQAKVAGTGERFPVLLYSHGGGYPQFTATFQTEYLASHGYVVVAIGHPEMNGVDRQHYPDGHVYRRWAEPKAGDDPPRSKESERERYERMWSGEQGGLGPAVHAMVRNIGFVLDRLEAVDGDRRHLLHRRLDLARVGAMGWSIGGATSLQASLDEPRIKAAINQDGWPYGLTGSSGVATKGSPRPIMVMNGGRPDITGIEGGKDAGMEELGKASELHVYTLFQRSAGDWYWLRLAHGNHGSFSDFPLFDPDPGAADPQGIHPRLAHAIINRYTLEFFDKYLRGRADTPLLSGAKRYRDASLMRKRGE